MLAQYSYNPIDYHFAWTADGWYTWDREAAVKAAKAARAARVRELKAQGFEVRMFSMAHQLVRRGGIGSGHPDVEFFVTCYFVNVLSQRQGV